jgi:hypothetical protein
MASVWKNRWASPSVCHLAHRLEHRRACGLIDTRRIGGEDVALEREGTGATATAQLPVFATSAFAAQGPLAQRPKERRRAPDIPKALLAQVTGDFG